MATPDELRANLATSRGSFRDALAGLTDAQWEAVPAAGEGEEAWSARKAAEHAIRAEAFFTSALCTACGYPGVDVPQDPAYATPAEALAAFDAVVEMTNKKLKYVTDSDLEKTHERLGSSENILNINIGHMNDHADQLQKSAAL